MVLRMGTLKARSPQRRAEFERQVLPHLNLLYGVGYRLTRSARDAEDLVQDTVLRAYRFWDSFQEHSNCKAWLCRILTNTFINRYQKSKRNREVLREAVAEQQTLDGILMHERAEGQQGPQDLLINRALSDEVELALAELPADFRIAVVLCDIQGFSYREIAEVMECPVGTVMSRLYRGRRILKKSLEEFATQQGFLKKKDTSETTSTEDAVVSLAEYQKGKARK